jgi:DNA-binding beta-propeller fold protein YncE
MKQQGGAQQRSTAETGNDLRTVAAGITRCLVAVLCPGLILLLLLPPAVPVVWADGGAPNLAYVAGASGGVAVIDIARQRVVTRLALGGDPHALLLSGDGGTLYATQLALGQLSAIVTQNGDPRCSAAVGGQPSQLALTPDGTTLYVGGSGDVRVRAVNPTTCAVTGIFRVPGPVYGLATSFLPGAFPGSTGSYQLWVASTADLVVFDSTSGKELADFPVLDGPRLLSIPPQSEVVYLSTVRGSIVALDLTTRRLTAPLLASGQFGSMDFDQTTGEVYVPDGARGTVDVLAPLLPGQAPPRLEPIRRMRTGGIPVAVAITNDGQLGFVALRSGQVAMLDIPGRHVVATIVVGGSPHFVITGQYPPAMTSSRLSGSPTLSRPTWGAGGLLVAGVLVLVGLAALLIAIWLIHRKRAWQSLWPPGGVG